MIGCCLFVSKALLYKLASPNKGKILCSAQVPLSSTCCMRRGGRTWFPSWDWRTGILHNPWKQLIKVLLEKGHGILPMFTCLCRTAAFRCLGCYLFATSGICVHFMKKIGQEKNPCICIYPQNWNSSQNPILKYIFLHTEQFWICKQGKLSDPYKLGIIFQRYSNNTSNCHPSALINEWTAPKLF